MKPISVKDRLPENNQYVLIHLTIGNWGDKEDPGGNRYWRVAKFVRGISMKDRERMKLGEIPDSTEIGWTCPTPPGDWVSIEHNRSQSYTFADEHGNNLVPYAWKEFGPDSYFGQEVDYWCELPSLKELDK